MVFCYFVITQFITLRATTFISLDKEAGHCLEVPVKITGVYSFDTNGYWSGHPLYNPSLAIYSLRMNNVLMTTAEYRLSILDIKAKLKIAGQKVSNLDLAQALLYWMSWSADVSNGSSSYRWQLTGDTRVIFDTSTHNGYLSNVEIDCGVKSVTTYNPTTGKFKISFPIIDYEITAKCRGISTVEDLGYDQFSYADTLDIKWDAVSHATAAAINEGVSTRRLVERVASPHINIVYLNRTRAMMQLIYI